MSEYQLLLKEKSGIWSDCRILAKKIELKQTNERLEERNRKFKLIHDSLTKINSIKERIARKMAQQRNSCSILKIDSCTCLSSEEIETYVRAIDLDLGPDFELEIQERVKVVDKDHYSYYVQVKVDW